MQTRKVADAPTTSEYYQYQLDALEFTDIILPSAVLFATLNQLVDALTGLERILTTPIPPSCVFNSMFYVSYA
jgi:predicted membrane chloride channel (bestrophin family)